MANFCINRNSLAYQKLQLVSGMQGPTLDAYCERFLTLHGRMPHVDELPGANSEPYLKKQLKINAHGLADFKHITDTTGKTTTPEINSYLNDTHRDLEVNVIRMGEGAIVETAKRPSKYTKKEYEVWPDTEGHVNSPIILEEAANKLSDLYGIQINTITTSELLSEEWHNKVPDASHVNAFILNNLIYLNVDNASVDAPVHELMHIFVGALRMKDPGIYQSILQAVAQLPNIQQLALKYPNRTQSDVLEEIFVTEMSRYVHGMDSAISLISDTARHDFLYNVHRVLDSILMGEFSAASVSSEELFDMSLRELNDLLHSAMLKTVSESTMTEAHQHRVLQNLKSQLMKELKLKQICI